MGNELFGNYSIEKNHFLTGGHLNMWKIYKAVHKERKKPVCVFVFEKKGLDAYQHSEKEELLNILRKEATSLMKFKHPNILSIIEPLSEDKYSLGFVTENFDYSLSSWVNQYKPSKIEIKLIITELCKTISFLHHSCHIFHLNLNPDCIFINGDNRLKIAGMNFAKECIGDKDTQFLYNLNTFSEVLNQNLNYVAPETVYKSKICRVSDIFSIGALIFYLLNQKSAHLIDLYKNTPENYKKIFNTIENRIKSIGIENKDDRDVIKLSLEENESKRLDIKGFSELEWFCDYKLKALTFIESLPTNDIVKNYEFLKQLPTMLEIFENKIIIKRFLPSLLSGLKIESLINPILPAIFAICEIPDIELNFEETIWPKLKELFKMNIIPAASLYFLLSKMTYIGEKISPDEFSEHCIPIICKAMDCGVSKIQGVVVDNLSFVSNNIDAQIFSDKIYPRIIQILLHTNSSKLKKRLLTSIKNLFSLLDYNMINTVLVNDLEKLRKIDNSSITSAGIELIYEEIVEEVSIEVIRKKIIPSLLSILIEGNISKDTYDRITSLIQKYLDKLKKSREKDLTDNNDFDFDEKEEEKNKKITKMEILDNESFLLNFFGDGNSDVIIGSPEATKTNTMNSTGSESNLDIIDEIKKGDIFEGFGIKDMNKKKIKILDKKIEKESKSPLSVSITKQKNINVFDNLLDNFNEGEEDLQTISSSNKKEEKIKPKISKSTAELVKTNEEIKPKKYNGWDSNEEDDDYSFPITSKRGKNKEIINSPIIDIKSNENKATEEKKLPKKENSSLFSKNKISSSNQLTKKKGAGIDLDSLLNF